MQIHQNVKKKWKTKLKMNILLTALPISILGYPTTKEGCQIEINSSNIQKMNWLDFSQRFGRWTQKLTKRWCCELSIEIDDSTIECLHDFKSCWSNKQKMQLNAWFYLATCLHACCLICIVRHHFTWKKQQLQCSFLICANLIIQHFSLKHTSIWPCVTLRKVD